MCYCITLEFWSIVVGIKHVWWRIAGPGRSRVSTRIKVGIIFKPVQANVLSEVRLAHSQSWKRSLVNHMSSLRHEIRLSGICFVQLYLKRKFQFQHTPQRYQWPASSSPASHYIHIYLLQLLQSFQCIFANCCLVDCCVSLRSSVFGCEYLDLFIDVYSFAWSFLFCLVSVCPLGFQSFAYVSDSDLRSCE